MAILDERTHLCSLRILIFFVLPLPISLLMNFIFHLRARVTLTKINEALTSRTFGTRSLPVSLSLSLSLSLGPPHSLCPLCRRRLNSRLKTLLHIICLSLSTSAPQKAKQSVAWFVFPNSIDYQNMRTFKVSMHRNRHESIVINYY
jgi:hypothetical protein